MGSIRVIKKKNGEESFHATIRLQGIIERRTWRTKSLAKDWIQKTEAAIKDGRYKIQTTAKKKRISDLIERFIAQLPQNHKYFHQKLQLLSRWKLELGHLSISDLSPSHIASVREKLLHEATLKKRLRTPSTVNRYLAAFSRVLSIAVKEWGWLEDNPMKRVAKEKENKGRTRFLAPEEKDRLLSACKLSHNPNLFPIVALALLTAMRYGEIVNLKWKDVDFDQKLITLHETKNGDKRVIPLIEDVRSILQKVSEKRNQSEFIFKSNRLGKRPLSIRKSFAKALRIAMIEDFRFHDLRHTAASYLAMNGATQGELMTILGHRSPQMTYKYAHFSQKHVRQVLERTTANLINHGSSNL